MMSELPSSLGATRCSQYESPIKNRGPEAPQSVTGDTSGSVYDFQADFWPSHEKLPSTATVG